MTPSDLAKYSMTRSVARSLCNSWASCLLWITRIQLLAASIDWQERWSTVVTAESETRGQGSWPPTFLNQMLFGSTFSCINHVLHWLFCLLSCRSRQRLNATDLSICLSVCRQNAKTRFSEKLSSKATVSIDDAHWLFKEPIIGPLKSKMAEIRHLENRRRHFSAVGGPIWIKFCRLMQNDMSTAVIYR